jgi:metal-responsive CopG/Arc/MetJ family transcriptional regulator
MQKKLGRPPKDTEANNVRLSRDLIDKLDDLRKTERDLPSRPEMIRRIMERYFESR